jgi:tetratricopeptide (TPR) repeat protein
VRRDAGSATRPQRGRRAAALAIAALVAAAAVAGCGPSRGAAYDRAFAEGARAEGAGRLAEAADGYDRAALAAVRPRDREQARWNAADVLVRAGRIADAVARLDALAGDASGEHAALAAYRAASLRVDHGDADRGWRDMEQVPRRFPLHGVAHVAVRRLDAHAEETSGPRAALDELHRLDADLGTTELAPLVAFLSAERIEELGDAAAARAAFARIADRWPYPGAFFDDALWRASLLDEKLGHPEVAIDDLERMVAQRETTTIIGSYERPKYVPAMLRIGALYRDRLHDRARARAAFHRLYTDFPNSTARDDALWLEAALWRDDGDDRAACDRLATLVREFPDSRYVPCATQQACGLTRPEKSRAPKDCHPYILRPAAGGPAGDGTPPPPRENPE